MSSESSKCCLTPHYRSNPTGTWKCPFCEQHRYKRPITLSPTRSSQNIYKTDGKVFFELDSSSSHNVACLLSLKSVERLFVAAVHKPDFRIFSKAGVYHLDKALAAINNWNLCLETWRAFHSDHTSCAKNSTTVEPRNQNDDVVGLDGDKDDVSTKRRKLDGGIDEGGVMFEPTFRVSCKCSGSAAKFFTPQRLSKSVGYQLRKQTGWRVQLRAPLFEVIVHINNGGLTIGLPLCDRPLSQRSYFKNIGLRSTTAWILTQLAKIQVGDTVLDPMCGTGTILVEAAKSSPDAIYFGSDNSDKQLRLAMENVNLAEVSGMVHLFQADVRLLPHILGHRVVDRIICDVPFGVNHLCVSDVKELYPRLIRAMDSILASHGRVVLLTSSTLKDFLLKQVEMMNSTVTPSSSPLGDRCLDAADCDDPITIPCVAQETKTTDDSAGYSSISCDGYQGNSTGTPVHSSVTPSVGEESESAVVSTNCSLSPRTNGETKTRKAPVSCSFASTAVSIGDQLQCVSEIPCMDSSSEDNRVHCSRAVSDDTSVTETSCVKSTMACDTVLRTDRSQDTMQKRCSHWTLESTHYFKLGETHSHACVFQKSIV